MSLNRPNRQFQNWQFRTLFWASKIDDTDHVRREMLNPTSGAMADHDTVTALMNAEFVPLEATELASKDILHATATWREVRVTVSPVASFVLEFYRQGNPQPGPGAYRRVAMRSNILKTDQPSAFVAFRCETSDPNYYVGRAMADFRPLGATLGSFIFACDVEGLLSGDSVGFRYTSDDVVGGTFRVEVFRSAWDTVLLEPMTKAGKKSLLTF